MLAYGCAWLRSRCAPLTAAAASLLGRCRFRRNAGLLSHQRNAGGMEGGHPLPPRVCEGSMPSSLKEALCVGHIFSFRVVWAA